MPPYGQEDIEELLSIFEIPHLRLEALFLDTQCKYQSFVAQFAFTDFCTLDRMPPQLGEFISDAVYDGQLSSNPDHPITGLACFFVDVNGATEKRNGTSWEASTVFKFYLRNIVDGVCYFTESSRVYSCSSDCCQVSGRL